MNFTVTSFQSCHKKLVSSLRHWRLGQGVAYSFQCWKNSMCYNWSIWLLCQSSPFSKFWLANHNLFLSFYKQLFTKYSKICESKFVFIFVIISSNKCWVSNKCHPLICAAPLGIHIEISASPLISPTPLNVTLITIVTIFY